MAKLKFESGSHNIPEWANWLAQDFNGRWWGFDDKPEYKFRDPGKWDYNTHVCFICIEAYPKDASVQLYKLVWS